MEEFWRVAVHYVGYQAMRLSHAVCQTAVVAICVLAAVPARANLIINPTFASSITSDANAGQIEAKINTAIGIYEQLFSDPITVDITFEEGGGLGASHFSLYQFSYSSFYSALKNDAKTADDNTAVARLTVDGTGSNNPVTGSDTVLLKPATAHALGLSCESQGCGAHQGGVITLNTAITNPGSPNSTLSYNLLPVIEHEIDEILGLGSTLGLGVGTDPSPEDFFRFDSAGARSFTTSSSAVSYFSLDGTTDLDQFNQSSSADYGDWQSNPIPAGVAAQVQDAFATAGANPQLRVELQALDAIGYDFVAPEPGTLLLAVGGLLAAVGARRIRRGLHHE
jgi:hypothetical protein